MLTSSATCSNSLHEINQRFALKLGFCQLSRRREPRMAVSLSSSTSTITPITLQPKLKTIHGLGTVNFGYSVNSHGVSLRRSAAVVSAITGASGTETADLLETVKVSDLRGNEIPISDLWKDRKAVVAFARHFGCVLCRKRAAYLAEKKDVMDASGVTLVLIGPGSIDQAKTFVEQTKFEGEVYADPNHASYEALKFASGVSVTFTPKAAMKIIESYMEGYRQDWKLSFMKDTVERGGWQQGGILVAGPGKNNISYIRKDKEAGDDPPVEEILKACCA